MSFGIGVISIPMLVTTVPGLKFPRAIRVVTTKWYFVVFSSFVTHKSTQAPKFLLATRLVAILLFSLVLNFFMASTASPGFEFEFLRATSVAATI